MIFRESNLPGAWIVEIDPHEDTRGFFARTFCAEEFQQQGLEHEFPSDEPSRSIGDVSVECSHPATQSIRKRWTGDGAGNEATFVVLNASPIDDIRNTRLIHSVVQRGTVVDRETLRVR